jgi:hypothetical protein
MSSKHQPIQNAVMLVRINAELRETFARLANQRGYSLSAGVRLAMEAWMQENKEVDTCPGTGS